MGLRPNSNTRTTVNGNKADRVVIEEGANPFAPAKNVDAITVEYPSATTEIYRHRVGGLTGSIVKSVEVIYTNSSKNTLVSVEII